MVLTLLSYVEIKCQLDATEVFIADLIGYVSGSQDASILRTGRITLSSTPDQLLEKKHSTKYHTQQPLYNTLELLMMGMVMPETC